MASPRSSSTRCPRLARLYVWLTLCSSAAPVWGAVAVVKSQSSSSTAAVAPTSVPGPAVEERAAATAPRIPSEGQRDDPIVLSSVPVVDIAPLLLAEGDGGGDGDGGAVARGDEEALGKMARDIHHALSNIGFMYVKNHGIPEELIEGAFEQSREFFSLPEEEKRKLSIDGSGEALHGWTDFFGENTDPERTRDYKEVYDLGRPAADGRTRPFFGPTPWPNPDDMPQFRDVLTTYHNEMLALARRIMKGLALSLDLPGDYFEDVMTEPVGIHRLLHYPSQEGIGGDRDFGVNTVGEDLETIGIGAHTDYGCIAILAQDDVGGLQILNRAGHWIDAPPIPGTFVINIGDMVQRLTNDVYIANMHRVINRTGRERYSIPFFFDVDFDTVWEPLSKFVTDERPARYEPTGCGQHKWERYKASYQHLNTERPVQSE